MMEQKAGEMGCLAHMKRMTVLLSRNALQRGDEIRSQSCDWGLVTRAWVASSKVYQGTGDSECWVSEGQCDLNYIKLVMTL